MDKYDTSQLTEFPRFEEEATQSGVSTFFNKLWKFPLFSPNEGDNLQNKTDDKPDVLPEEPPKQEEEEKPEPASYAMEFEGRSLQNVLKRISSLVALGSGSGTRYADTELARYWMPDDVSRECYECASRFSALRRRHHCRVCGQIFCSRCCSQRVPGQIFGCAGGLRVCTYCCKVVLSYLRERDPAAAEIATDLRSLQETLQSKFPDNKSAEVASSNFVFSREQDSRERPSAKEALKDVFKHLALALPTQQHRYRLVRYNGVWRGCDVLQWVMDNTNEKTRTQANELCQRLLAAGYLECAGDAPPAFADYALYRPREIDPPSSDNDEPAEKAQRLVESVSSYCLDLNLGENSARLIKAPPQLEQKSPSSSDEESPVTDQVEEAKPGCSALSRLGEEHLRLVFRQCLSRAALPAAWADALYPLCRQAAEAVMPDQVITVERLPSDLRDSSREPDQIASLLLMQSAGMCKSHHNICPHYKIIDMYGNDIDARNYVHVKKVCSGRAKDSCLVPGVVLTKNVVHRGMPQQISNPTVLLLDCSIVYQRVEGKHTSLEPVLMQEQEYLSRCAMRIAALRPRVVLVRGAAARAVQDTLRAQGVALAVGVGLRALRRAARCCGGEVVTSIDARIGTPRLGTCSNFYVKTLPTKTLMVLEGCAEPHLGCSIILRGESLPELVRVKKVVKFMVLACYNWKLEKSFLADIDAILPEPGTTFDDDNDNDVFGDKNNDKAETDSQGTNEVDVAKGIDNDDSISEETLKPNYDVNNESNQFDEDNNDSSNDTDLFRNDDCKSNQISKIIAETESSEILNTGEKKDGTKDECIKDNVVDKNSELNEKDKVKERVGVTNEDKIEDKTEVEIDDPLLSSKYTSDKNLSCGVPIRDFSDPLRAIGDDEVFLHEVEEKFKSEDDMGDRWSSDTILSMSANVCVPPPCGEVAWPSPPRAPERAARGSKARMDRQREESAFVGITPPHPFVLTPMAAGADDPALRAALAHYRATGARILNNHHRPGCALYKPTVLKPPKEPEPETEKQDDSEPLDPLAPENHQRLSLLLYSFSSKSANVPDFCVNPWIVTMEMYGKHDISLGAFLRKYCFDPHQKCSSNNCQVPVNQHVRRFVHGDVCITITCNTVGHSNVDKYKDEDNKQISFRSRCPRCGTPSRALPVRRPSLALSLAQYVRLRALARRAGPRGRGCPHPLHAHTHMFVQGLTTASFKYNKISTFDVKLPPPEIATNYDTRQMRDALISQLNDLMLKGHETFAPGAEGEQGAAGAAFKQHTDQIHLALTAKHLYEAPSLAGVVRRLWGVSDALTLAEKMVADAADRDAGAQALSGKQSKPEPAVSVEEKSDIEDSSGDPANDSSEEDEEKGDKKTVRQILIQLLSNNQPSNQRGLAVVGGLIPVWARGGDIGAVVAAALASVTYHRTLRANAMAARHSVQTEQEEVESSNSGKEKGEGDKSKPAKPNDHIEVLLKDNLLCRIYFASQFLKLRHMLLAPLDPDRDDRRCCDDFKEKDAKNLCSTEECFLRSLSHCVPWAARGGKSGSTFCKTKDDRFVLKEMTKPEWQQFLEFAPHYFGYVTNCHQNKLPSLLARIVGVYSVGGAGNGVLVMENVWYGAAPAATRYDLKGAQRHRLASRDQDAAAVLLDENLLNLRWETPLYIPSHRGAVLWRGLARDAAFLARHTVMDYSLLLGIDGGTLVLGIIDYIRTFTWDKKLEHLVKKNLGSGQPTVVSPEQYKRRFHAACRKYFLQCPSYWDHLCQEELQE